MRDRLKRRHRQQHPQPQTKHQIALELGRPVTSRRLPRGRDYFSAAKNQADHRQRRSQVDQRGQEQFRHDRRTGHLAADPQHGGGDIAHRRPRPACVGGDDHEPSQIKPVLARSHQLANQRNHYDGGGQVIEHGAEQERYRAHDPDQRDQALRVNALGHHFEPAVGVDHFDHGHRTH